MTASERLRLLSGMTGVTAAVMLASLGSGATAGTVLVSYSGVPSATAAVHLLTDVSREVTDPIYFATQAYSKRVVPVSLYEQVMLDDSVLYSVSTAASVTAVPSSSSLTVSGPAVCLTTDASCRSTTGSPSTLHVVLRDPSSYTLTQSLLE